MSVACIVALAAGPAAAASIRSSHCIDIDFTDLNELYHTPDSFVTEGCSDAYLGSRWRPVARWVTAPTYEIAPPDYQPVGETPAEDFLAKLESARYVIDAGTDEESSVVVDGGDLFTDRATLFDVYEMVRFSARLPGLSIGFHTVDLFGTLSAEHWDGLGLEENNHLPAGETYFGSAFFFVSKPEADPKGPPPPVNPMLRIELTWDTEADLDLHLLHPNGDWNDFQWDCFWANRSPDWGSQVSTLDDPILEVDDTDGFGPEVITLGRPEHVTYQVGVMNFFGDPDEVTAATVRVWNEDLLVAELSTEFPGPLYFWTVAAVSLQGNDIIVTPIDVMESVIPDEPPPEE